MQICNVTNDIYYHVIILNFKDMLLNETKLKDALEEDINF